MLHPLKALATATLILGMATACASTDTPNAAPSPVASTAAASPSSNPAGSLLTKQATCLSFLKVTTATSEQMAKATIVALGAITDPSKVEPAVKELTAVVTAIADGMETEAAQAGDAALKAALTEYASVARESLTAMKAAGKDVDKVMDAINDVAMTKSDEKITAMC